MDSGKHNAVLGTFGSLAFVFDRLPCILKLHHDDFDRSLRLLSPVRGPRSPADAGIGELIHACAVRGTYRRSSFF